jgi:hypothetical protein
MEKFKIIKVKETGEIWLAKPYFLDSSKHTLFCKYESDKAPVFEKYAKGNEYNSDIEIIGNYETDKIDFHWRNGITYFK